MTDGWIMIRKEFDFGNLLATDVIVAAFAFRDSALIVTERGQIYRVYQDELDEGHKARPAGLLKQDVFEPDQKFVEALVKLVKQDLIKELTK